MDDKFTYRTRRDISPAAVQTLFRRNRWRDWLTQKEIQWYLDHALFVATAWHGRKLIGLAVLCGEGRMHVSLENLLVDKPSRGSGVGTALMMLVLSTVEELKPHAFHLDVSNRRTEMFFSRFGFRKSRGSWVLEHRDIANDLRKRIQTQRARRKARAKS